MNAAAAHMNRNQKVPKGDEPAWASKLRRDLSDALERLVTIEERRRNELDAISELQRQYQQIIQIAAQRAAPSSHAESSDMATAMLKGKLSKLTIKRHAVLTAVVAGVGYQELTNITGWDVTTVKLQLRAALHILGIPNRETLLVQHKKLLDPISDSEYQRLYGVSKRWWLEQPEDLMTVLRTTKAPANQHTTVKQRGRK